jgi:hypothetical protein
LVIELPDAKGIGRKQKRSRNVIEVPWRKTPSTRRREILLPESKVPRHTIGSQRISPTCTGRCDPVAEAVDDEGVLAAGLRGTASGQLEYE